MYQSIRILQLVYPFYRAPQHHLHDKKRTFTISDKSTKKVKLKVTFFVTTWDSSKLNHNGKGHVLPTLIQFHIPRTSTVKVTFNRNSGERLAPDAHFTAAS